MPNAGPPVPVAHIITCASCPEITHSFVGLLKDDICDHPPTSVNLWDAQDPVSILTEVVYQPAFHLESGMVVWPFQDFLEDWILFISCSAVLKACC